MAEEKDIENEEEIEEEKPKKTKKKKVVRRRKSTKEKENPVVSAIRLAVESGEVEFGSRRSLAAGNTKLLIIAENAPDKIKKDVSDAKAPVLEFSGSTMQLGAVCGKPFPVSVLSIMDAGNSNILELAKKKK